MNLRGKNLSIMNLRGKNLSIIASAPVDVLRRFDELWSEPTHEDGFDLDFIDDFEKENCKRYNVNLRGIRLRSVFDWAMFKTLNFELPQVIEVFSSIFKKGFFDDRQIEAFFFKGYYAQAHDDNHLWWRRQVMVVLDNPLGHRLWCNTRMFAPQAGDVVLMYPHRKHALYPAENLTATQAAKGPFRMISVVFE